MFLFGRIIKKQVKPSPDLDGNIRETGQSFYNISKADKWMWVMPLWSECMPTCVFGKRIPVPYAEGGKEGKFFTKTTSRRSILDARDGEEAISIASSPITNQMHAGCALNEHIVSTNEDKALTFFSRFF